MLRSVVVTLMAVFSVITIVGCAKKADDSSKRADPAPAASNVTFASVVKPALDERCGRCHARETKGGFSIQTLDTVLRGGKSGPAIAPGNADNSLLYRMASGKPGVKHMPPKGEPLNDAQLASVKAWIDGGAK